MGEGHCRRRFPRGGVASTLGDGIEFCEAAVALWMRATRFETPTQLRDGLAQPGLEAA